MSTLLIITILQSWLSLVFIIRRQWQLQGSTFEAIPLISHCVAIQIYSLNFCVIRKGGNDRVRAGWTIASMWWYSCRLSCCMSCDLRLFCEQWTEVLERLKFKVTAMLEWISVKHDPSPTTPRRNSQALLISNAPPVCDVGNLSGIFDFFRSENKNND